MERGNLPVQHKSFVGRQREIAELIGLVRRHRLVTLLGPVGIGKTRLALRLAETIQHDFRDGAWFVELTSPSQSVPLADTFARVLGVAASDGSDPLTRLCAALHGCRCLLVVDNCEGVVDQLATVVQRLVHECPDLKVVATSKRPVRIDAEREWRVPALDLPEADRDYSAAQLEAMDSVALFVERARRRDEAFAVERSGAGDVIGLVRYLDGLPLALELAAAWTGTLSPGELLLHLRRHPHDLEDGDRGGDPRHSSLRAAIDSSYRSLDHECQELVAELSVFPSGWNLDAMDAVCAQGTGVSRAALRQLIDRSFVTMQAAPGGPTRYRMLGVIRRYAMNQLEETGHVDATLRRFVRHFADLATAAGSHLTTRDGPRWLQVLDVELDNLRAVLTLDQADPDDRLRVALALVPYWHLRGLLGEGLNRLDVIVRSGLPRSPAVVQALNGLSRLSWARGDTDMAARMARQAFHVARRIHDSPGVAWSLVRMAQASFDANCPAAARRCAEHAHRLSAGWADGPLAAACLFQLGQVALVEGRLDEADTTLRRAIDLFARNDQVDQEAIALLILGRVRLRQDRIDDAEAVLIRSLSGVREFALPRHTVPIVESLAVVALRQGNRPRAARLYGGAAGLLRRMGARPPARAPMRKPNVVLLQPLATAPDTRRTFEEGCTMDVVALIAHALGDPTPVPEVVQDRSEPASDVLTARQLEVAELVAKGMTNKEIGARLHIKDRTVERHISDICDKWTCNNRTEIAVALMKRTLVPGSG